MAQHERLWTWWRRRSATAYRLPGTRGRRSRLTPAIEALEGRRLLSYTGPSAIRAVSTAAGIFLIQVSGPGLIKVHPGGKNAIDLSAFGTTSGSTITVSLTRPHYHMPSGLLDIHALTVTSGQLGGLDASSAILTGAMTPLNNSVNTLELGALGPAAPRWNQRQRRHHDRQHDQPRTDGPRRHLGALNTANSPATGTAGVADLTGVMTIGSLTIDGGQFVIGLDSLTPIAVAGNMSISHDGRFSIGRDLDGSLSINGDLVLDTGGQLYVGRNLAELFVNGNLIVNPTESGIVVGGALSDLTVNGYFQGQGGTALHRF